MERGTRDRWGGEREITVQQMTGYLAIVHPRVLTVRECVGGGPEEGAEEVTDRRREDREMGKWRT